MYPFSLKTAQQIKRYHELVAAYDKVVCALDELWEHLTIIDRDLPAEVARIPVRESFDTSTPASITVEWFKGVPARLEAAAAMCEIRYRPNQDRRATVRSQGVIAVSPRTLEIVHSVNNAKQVIRSVLKSLGEYRAFHYLYMHACNEGDTIHADGSPADVCISQLRRLIPILTEPPRQVSFSWTNSHTINTRCTRDVWLRKISRMIALSAEDPDRLKKYQEYYAAILDGVTESNQELVQRRPYPPKPLTNIRNQDGTTRLRPVPLPIVLDARWSFPAIHPLNSYVRSAARRMRSDLGTDVSPIVPGMNLYRAKR